MKKKTNSWYRKKCVDKAKIKAKELINYECERCFKTKKQGWQMHGNHVYSEGVYKSMSADVDNIICLCAQCHFWWHENPIESSEWFKEKYPKRYKILRKRSQDTKVIDWEKRYNEVA